jgi:hypothetical protein
VQVQGFAPKVAVSKTFAVVDSTDQITAELLLSLPDHYIVKATHGSQMTMVMGPEGGRCIKT